MGLKSNADILKYARASSLLHGVSLTPFTFGFYVELVKVVAEHGDKTSDTGLYSLSFTSSDLEKMLGFQTNRLSALFSQLSKCDLLSYVESSVGNVTKDRRFKSYVVSMDLSDVLE